jgi:hypothetical protein
MKVRTLAGIAAFACWLAALLTLLAAGAPVAMAAAGPGTIAYVRLNDATGDEIWLIQPDGSNNRRIWTSGQPDPYHVTEITDLDWRPDATALAFASDHEFTCSRYESDIYRIWADGSGYRRLTNGPACGALAGYPKGSVTVTVRNYTTRGPFFVYVQGAPGVLMAAVAPGGSSTLTFSGVADLGDVLQQAVVIEGPSRWIAPIAAADVRPGQTVHAGAISVVGDGLESFGAYVPSWHRGGARFGYVLGEGADMYQLSADPALGESGTQLIKASGAFPNAIDRGPTAATANQILYYSYLNYGIHRVAEGSATIGQRLVATEAYELVYDVQWLPDGSGFLYTKQTFDDNFVDNANIFAYSFATGVSTPLTNFVGEFARDLTLSPDGQQIVFERSATKEFSSVDLWIMNRDGGGLSRLVQNARLPSWSQVAPQSPRRLYVPLARD